MLTYNSFSNLYPNPNGYGYVVRKGTSPKADSIGAVKQNFTVCDISGNPLAQEFQSGNYIKIADDYFAESYDSNNILYDTNGDPQIIAFDDLANVTSNQLFVSLDKQKITFYQEALDPSGDCYTKAMKEMKLVEPLQDVDGSPLYDTDGDRLYSLKEGVVIE
jgi:hypothetical protein